ncbi:MAG: LysM peptidoglycan-binding domain-containing protein [Acidimicrobiales bacterium]
MKRPWFTVAAWVAGPPAVAVSVVVLGELGSLGWPPAPTDWAKWIIETDPSVALVAMLRLGVVVGCALMSLRVWLAITVGLAGPSRPPERRRVIGPRSLRVALLRIARPVAVAGIGVGVASSTVMAHPAAATGRPAGDTPAASPAVEPAGSIGGPDVDGASTHGPAEGSSFAEMRRVRIELASFTTDNGRPEMLDEWVVEPGDHLWSIAAETLAEHLGETPSERRVARYWQRLIEANRDRLVIPGEPDVIMPGQHLVVPRPASGTAQRSGT